MKKQEATEKVKVTIKLPKPLYRRAQHYAVDSEQDVQDIIAAALDLYLKSKSPKGDQR